MSITVTIKVGGFADLKMALDQIEQLKKNHPHVCWHVEVA